jgi:putative endonuclease
MLVCHRYAGRRTLKALKGKHWAYYVYVLLCDDGSYYTGYSSTPSARLVAHMKGQGARYTRMRKPSRIVYVEKHRTRRGAMIREREIKALTHEQKRSLTETMDKTRKHSKQC